MNPTIARQLVCDALMELAQTVRGDAGRLNERTIEHRFSYLMQCRGLSLGLDGPEPTLHPGWATYNEAAAVHYARFRRKELPLTWQYYVDDSGAPGILDFAVGPYQAPWAGIELRLKRDWVHEDVVFDLMKLLHPGLPFHFAASLSVFLSPGRRAFRATHSARVVIGAALETATQRLRAASLDGPPRPFLSLFVEVLDDGARSVWRLTGEGRPEEILVARPPVSERDSAHQPLAVMRAGAD